MLVKFTQQYGTDTHRAWEAIGLVPQMVAEPVKLQNGWEQIQTVYLTSGWLRMSLLQNAQVTPSEHIKCLLPGPEESKSLSPRAQELLVAAHNVMVDGQAAAHGDARPDNILVLLRLGKIIGLKLIDLDWAGIAGIAKYPMLLNTRSILWPDGVAAGLPLHQRHDLELFDLQVDPATASGSAGWRQPHTNWPPSELSSNSEDMDSEWESTSSQESNLHQALLAWP